MTWKAAPVALVATMLCLGGIAPAAASDDHAADNPQNGSIAFGRLDPAIGDFSLWVAKSNGTGQKRITKGRQTSQTGHPTAASSRSTFLTTPAFT